MGQKYLKMAGSGWVLLGPCWVPAGSCWVLLGPAGSAGSCSVLLGPARSCLVPLGPGGSWWVPAGSWWVLLKVTTMNNIVSVKMSSLVMSL